MVALNKKRLEAIIIGDGFHENNIFDVESPRNRDNCFAPFFELRRLFLENDIELNTTDLTRQDGIQFELHLDVQKALQGNTAKYVMLYESPQVRPINNSNSHLEMYRRVFTWRDELVDGKRFIKFNLPNKFIKSSSCGWIERSKLCCLISANKTTPKQTPLELYSQRVNTIRWFEKNAPEAFDLFGSGWDTIAAKPGFASRIIRKLSGYLPKDKGRVFFPSYRGKVVSKIETMQKYRFSICYENVRDLPGYITEKIWDSFFAGCIPVYWGASNITDYIPEDCFVDRRKFESHEQLYEFMTSMSTSEYTAYQERIEAFLISEKTRPFSSEAFAETIVNTILKDIGLAG